MPENPLGDGAGVGVALGLLRNPHSRLKTLSLGKTGLGEGSGRTFARVLRSKSCALKRLNLRGNTGMGIPVLVALKENVGLRVLTLQNCQLTAGDGFLMAQALRNHHQLQKIQLGYNSSMGDAACSAIIVACGKKLGLPVTTLDLQCTGVGATAGSNLAKHLRANNSLKAHFLGNNELDVDTWKNLFAALAVNNGLTSLWLNSCELNTRSVSDLAAALNVNGTLGKLQLVDNDIGVASVVHLAVAIAVNRALHTLDLSRNHLCDTCLSASALSAVLRSNKVLLGLKLGGNATITELGENHFSEVAREGSLCNASFD